MASILNKSTHPVQVKKISLHTWRLRDEVEHMIAQRITPDNDSPDIEDIKKYFAPENVDPVEGFERQAPEKTVNGEMILSDVNMKTILIFSDSPYTPGQNIGVKFNLPKSFILTAQVENSLYQGRNSKVIGTNKYHYRLQCKFEFQYGEDREKLRNFLKAIEPEIVPEPTKNNNQGSQSDDDDFDDFGL